MAAAVVTQAAATAAGAAIADDAAAEAPGGAGVPNPGLASERRDQGRHRYRAAGEVLEPLHD